MPDETLKNTLPPLPPRTDPSTMLTGNAKKDIASLEKGAENVEAFSSVMRGIGTRAYDTRQKADLELAGKQFDPTKVSGGTFSSIIGNLEQRRGTDVSKTYTAGMTAFEKQEARKERLASEIREEQRLKEQREREDRIRQEENDRELKNQAMMMGVTNLSGSSKDLRTRIASAVNAKKNAQKSIAKSICGETEDKKDAISIEEQVENALKSLGLDTETDLPVPEGFVVSEKPGFKERGLNDEGLSPQGFKEKQEEESIFGEGFW